MPSRGTIGMNTGSVISIMLTWSTKMPRKIRISIISATSGEGGQALAEDGGDQPLGGAGETQDLGEGGGARG